MSFANVGKRWSTQEELRRYLAGFQPPKWAKGVVLHHTAIPDLAARPLGLTPQHIRNLEAFYRSQGWSAGPHLFVDDIAVSGMTPPAVQGVHARAFNATHLGIEVLGNYDRDSPTQGRGAQCWSLAAGTVAAVLDWLGLSANASTVRLHRDDPKARKSCPGTLITQEWAISEIAKRTKGEPCA